MNLKEFEQNVKDGVEQKNVTFYYHQGKITIVFAHRISESNYWTVQSILNEFLNIPYNIQQSDIPGVLDVIYNPMDFVHKLQEESDRLLIEIYGITSRYNDMAATLNAFKEIMTVKHLDNDKV